jgi:hypothetical protein
MSWGSTSKIPAGRTLGQTSALAALCAGVKHKIDATCESRLEGVIGHSAANPAALYSIRDSPDENQNEVNDSFLLDRR